MSTKFAVISLASLSVAASKEWAIVPGTAATTLVGVGASSKDLLVAGASNNGDGGFIEQYDGDSWVHDKIQGGLLMDAAASEQVIVGVSMWPLFLSNDNGKSFETVPSISGLSQDANIFGSGSDIGLVGSFALKEGDSWADIVTGVAHSGDAGATWSVSEVAGDVRYGSFPSQDTWYVSAGMWPVDATTRTADSAVLSSHISMVSSPKLGESKMIFNKAANSTTLTSSGYYGSISKTTDGGATWTEVYHSAASDNFYFNGIACTSDTHCVAVGEGATSTDNIALLTTDGGATWTQSEISFASNVVSCMGVAWMSETEGWLGATAKSGRELEGLFYKTVDGGKSYELAQEIDNCFIMDIDSVGEAGVASCISSSGGSASVAQYQ